MDFKLLTPSLFTLEKEIQQISSPIANTDNLNRILSNFGRELSTLSPNMFCENTSSYLQAKLSNMSAQLAEPSILFNTLFTSALQILRKSSPEEESDSHAKNLIETLTHSAQKEKLLSLYPHIYKVKNNGLILQELDPVLQNEPIVVETAVSNNGLALEFASSDLQRNLSIVNLAVANNWNAIGYAANELFPKCVPIAPYLQTLGYKIKKEGGCFGYSLLGIHALLIEDFSSFTIRNKKFIHAYKTKNFSCLMENSEVKTDFLSFFSCLSILSDFSAYSKEFDQEKQPYFQWEPPILSTPIRFMLSEKLANKGGFRTFPNVSGIYTKQDFSAYFTSLEDAFKNSPYPFAVHFGNAEHAIGVGYDPKDKQWILINIATNPSPHFRLIEDLADAAWSALLPQNKDTSLTENNDLIAVGSKIYVTGDRASFFRQKWNQWRKSPSFRSIHKITQQKALLKDGFKNSWIVVALNSRDLKTASKLLKYIDATQRIDALIAGILGNYTHFVETLLLNSNMDVNKEGSFYKIPPLIATAKHRFCLSRLLLKYGAKVSTQSSLDGITPLMTSASHGSLENVKLLVSHDPNTIHQTNTLGQNALMYAASKDRIKILDFLLRKKANYLQVDNNGFSPLLLSSLSNSSHCMKKLLDWDPSTIHATDTTGNTALLLAISKNHFDCVKIAIETNPLTVTIANASGTSPFALATKQGDFTILEMLLDTGLITPEDKGKALALACEQGDLKLVSFLLTLKNINLDVAGKFGMTGLIWAASQGNTALCDQLLAAGADPSKPASNGQKAYSFASLHGYSALSDTLFAATKIFDKRKSLSQPNLS